MPEPVAHLQDVWDACVGFGDLVFDVHDQVAWQRDRRLDGYAGWRMSVPAADALDRTLLALRLYALSHDAAVTTGRPLTRTALAGLPLADVAEQSRPHYELFAGLTAVSPTADQSHRLTVLALLSYETPGGALALERLSGMLRITVNRLRDRYRNPGLTLGDLADVVRDGPAGAGG